MFKRTSFRNTILEKNEVCDNCARKSSCGYYVIEEENEEKDTEDKYENDNSR